MSSLLEPAFLRRLGRLRLAVRRRFAGSSAGGRRSLRRGSSAEFAEHRPYYAGDDVRRIDWNAYARLEELVLRALPRSLDLDGPGDTTTLRSEPEHVELVGDLYTFSARLVFTLRVWFDAGDEVSSCS